MKIIYVVPEMQQGGVEECTYDLARGMVSLGNKVWLVSYGGHLLEELKNYGVQTRKAPVHRKDLFSFLRSLSILKHLCQEFQPDIIHCMSRVPAWVGYLAVRCYPDIHLVTSFHSFYNRHWPSQIMGKGERVIAVSRNVAEYARDVFRVPEKRLRVVRNGIKMEEIKKILEPELVRIGTLARWSKGKGFSLFLRIIKQLVEDGQKVKGVLGVGLGERGNLAIRELKKEITEHSLGARIELLINPRREDFFSRIDIYAGCFTRPEGFGRVLVESQWCQVVPVASCLGATREVIWQGKTGFLVQPRVESFVEKLKFLIENPAVRERMGQAGADWVRKEFSEERMVKETLDIYRELV